MDPDDAELLSRESVVRRASGDAAGADSCRRCVLTLTRPERLSRVDAGVYGHLTRRNPAAVCEARGARAEAAGFWAGVLAERPGDPEAVAAPARLGPPA